MVHRQDGPALSAGRFAVVERPGALTTVQDAGRPGLAHLGVPPSGALDPGAHRLANRLVGNPEEAAALETTVDGVRLRFEAPAAVAVTGARAAVSVDARPVGWAVPVAVMAGQVVDVGRAEAGVRCYLAVSGGWAVPPTLGSMSTDVLSGLGPGPLAGGQRLAFGPACGPPAAVDVAPYPAPGRHAELVTHPGPRQAWVTPAGWETLSRATFTVAPASNRIGLRLQGPPVERAVTDELPSEGMVRGAVQLHPDGNLVVLLADHPTTGGYPVVAVVDPASWGACAQAAPGTTVGFRPPRRPPRAGAWSSGCT